MASGVNVKMGVTGVSQFKQNINTARQSLKTLDAQLALNEKQFKASGDAETYMQEKSELLKVKLEEQKSIAANCEKALAQMASNGVDKASKAYQDMQRQLLEAKGAMLDTETAMQGVTDETDKAADNVSEMNSQLKDIGKGVSYDNVTNGISKITSAMQTAFNKAIELGKAITREVLGAGTWADDLNTRASFYGIDQDLLQRMEKTATLIDTPVEAIINAKKKLNKELAAQGKNDMGAWAALGINPNDAKDADDLLWKTGEAIMQLTDESQKEYYAQELLGRSWNELIPLFEAGREKYEETNASWSTVTQEQVDNLQELNDKYNELLGEFNTIKTSFFGEIAPALTGVMGTITDLLQKFNEYLKSPEGQKAMEKLGETISELITSLVSVDPKEVVNGLASAINSLVEGLNWIKENKNLVVGGIEAIGIAFAGMKIAELALNIGKIVNGFGLLTGGKAGAAGAGEAGAGGAGSPLAVSVGSGGLSGITSLLASPIVQANAVPVGDWFLHHTHTGRAIAGNESWETVGSSFEEWQRSVDRNFQTFFEDWAHLGDPNYQSGTGGATPQKLPETEGNMTLEEFREQRKTLRGQMEQDAWAAEHKKDGNSGVYFDAPGGSSQVEESLDAMTQAADEMNNSTVKHFMSAGTDISDAAKAMPKETAAAVSAAVSAALNGASVVINGSELTAVVGSLMAGVLARYQL